MQKADGISLRRSSSLRGPRPWNSNKNPRALQASSERNKLSVEGTKGFVQQQAYKSGKFEQREIFQKTSTPGEETSAEPSQVAKDTLSVGAHPRPRRRSSPGYRTVEYLQENNQQVSRPNSLSKLNDSTPRSPQASKPKPARRRKTGNRNLITTNSSSSDDENLHLAGARRRTASPRSNSSPHCTVGLNSPVLQRKLHKVINKRSNSENNFQKKTRKIRLEGCTYKLTMEPHAATDDESASRVAERTSLPDACSAKTNGTRSSSLPRTKTTTSQNKEQSLSPREMKQAQKWVSEREDQARRINLTRPIRLPSSEDEHQNNGITEDSPTVLPGVDTRDALDCAALRLRRITQEIDKGNVTSRVLKDTLQYAISVLEMKFLNRTSYSDDDSDADASLQGDSIVPPEIKRWLMQTFSTSGADEKTKRKRERRTLRSVVHVMQAGMFVERMFRKSSAAANFDISPDIQNHIKGIGDWHYDIFGLETVSGGHALKYTFYEVLSKYDFIRKFKISVKSLFSFCDRLQVGYWKHNNRYHNPIHAADVTQCISIFLNESGFVNWLSELEIFAMIFAATVHDLEHTGTTNTFHAQTRSDLALLYNDKSVLENHHASAAFRILWEDPECDILSSLSKDDYKQFRELVIDMVLSTDMSLHFGQIKNMKSMLQHPEKMERSKAMSLMMHCADISHPTRPWEQHHRWTARLIEEFFVQGDKERELQLPISPLSDRHTTMVAQSQIGFIDYVIKPTFEILHDLFWRISVSVTGESTSSEDEENGPKSHRPSTSHTSTREISDTSPRRFSEAEGSRKQTASKIALKAKIKAFRNNTTQCMKSNRQKWVEKDKEEQLARQAKQSRENSTEEQTSTSSDNHGQET